MTTPPPEKLVALRKQIDALDDQLVGLLAQRFDLVKTVVGVKQEYGLPAIIPERMAEVFARVRAQATVHGFLPDSAEKLWRQLVDDMIAYEETQLNK